MNLHYRVSKYWSNKSCGCIACPWNLCWDVSSFCRLRESSFVRPLLRFQGGPCGSRKPIAHQLQRSKPELDQVNVLHLDEASLVQVDPELFDRRRKIVQKVLIWVVTIRTDKLKKLKFLQGWTVIDSLGQCFSTFLSPRNPKWPQKQFAEPQLFLN